MIEVQRQGVIHEDLSSSGLDGYRINPKGRATGIPKEKAIPAGVVRIRIDVKILEPVDPKAVDVAITLVPEGIAVLTVTSARTRLAPKMGSRTTEYLDGFIE